MQLTTTRVPRKAIGSLADERLKTVAGQLEEFFQIPHQPSEALIALLEQNAPPSSSISETIVDLFSQSVNRPSLSKLLDRAVHYLHLDEEEKLIEQKSEYPRNFIHQTVMKNYPSLFGFLLNHGWNPNSVLPDQKTPLSIAVVSNPLDPVQRLTYIQTLLSHGADPLIADVNDVSPFKRLCGMESNYPLVYEYFRDHLLAHHPAQTQNQFNQGLINAVFNGCLPMVTDLLEHGALLPPLLTIDSSTEFLRQISSTIFSERRSVSLIDPFLLCLIQILRSNVPCENWSIFIEQFFRLIYIPGVCSVLNNAPQTCPSLDHLKKFLFYSFHFGYLTSEKAQEIRTTLLPEILENPSVTSAMREGLVQTLNGYFDELRLRYHQNPVSLRLRSIRMIRQSIDHLYLDKHLKTMIYPL